MDALNIEDIWLVWMSSVGYGYKYVGYTMDFVPWRHSEGIRTVVEAPNFKRDFKERLDAEMSPALAGMNKNIENPKGVGLFALPSPVPPITFHISLWNHLLFFSMLDEGGYVDFVLSRTPSKSFDTRVIMGGYLVDDVKYLSQLAAASKDGEATVSILPVAYAGPSISYKTGEPTVLHVDFDLSEFRYVETWADEGVVMDVLKAEREYFGCDFTLPVEEEDEPEDTEVDGREVLISL